MSEIEKLSWFTKLKSGLSNTANKISNSINDIFTKSKLDSGTLDELEELLILSDLGPQVASEVTKQIAQKRYEKEITADEIKQVLVDYITSILNPLTTPIIVNEHKPHVILLCGVNGNGKTTTAGKLAHYYKSQGKKVMLAACDTFRAAAVHQLEIWAERTNSSFFKGEQGRDPASVAFQALTQAQSQDIDVLLIDTAGRLQNKNHLMEELAKIIKVINKIDEQAPHNVVLVLDATTGQNAHSQVEVFKTIVKLSGIIVTKLDGTAKAGVVVALARKFGLPVNAIGIGEGVEDLKPFDAQDFARNLVGLS